MSTLSLCQRRRQRDLSKVRSHVGNGPDRATGVRLAALWLATAGLAGANLMGLELVAFRLYAPYFGYSIYVWGSLISVIMGALAAGYALGGVLADRWRTGHPMYGAILLSAAYQLLMLWMARTALLALSTAGDLAGPGLATLVIFVPPMTRLAMVGPCVIRLLARAGRVGAAAGAVYAVSTAGGIAGVLLTSFVLVPQWGTWATLEMLCGLTAVLGAQASPAASPGGS